jgi:hypothetical protein
VSSSDWRGRSLIKRIESSVNVRQTSFIHFVYPFRFDPETFTARADAVDRASWGSARGRTNVWQPARLPKEEMLAHVARCANPRDGAPATGYFWRLHDGSRSAYGSSDWRLVTPRGEIPFRFGGGGKSSLLVALALFHIGVGFLTLRAQPLTRELAGWLNFQHFFRFMRGDRSVHARADPSNTAPTPKPDVRPGLAPGLGIRPGDSLVVGSVLDALLASATIDGEGAPWWHEVFIPGRLLPFAALFVDGVPEQEHAHLLHRVRKLSYFDQKGIRPGPDDLRPDHPALLARSANQWFAVGREGASFVAFDAPDIEFSRSELPAHLGGVYFFCYLFSLHQRFGLLALTEALATCGLGDDGAGGERSHSSVDYIRDGFMAFTTRSYFSEIVHSENHNRYFHACREALRVERLYREVGEKLTYAHTFLTAATP